MSSVHKQVLYDIEWQDLRTKLLSRHRDDGGWATVEGATTNISMLEDYLGDLTDVSKLWRVINLLDAVRMGYSGQRRTGSPQDQMVKEYRDDLNIQYAQLKEQGAQHEAPLEEATIADIQSASEETLRRIHNNLLERWTKHSTSQHRDELRHFLDLIEEHRPEVTKEI